MISYLRREKGVCVILGIALIVVPWTFMGAGLGDYESADNWFMRWVWEWGTFLVMLCAMFGVGLLFLGLSPGQERESDE